VVVVVGLRGHDSVRLLKCLRATEKEANHSKGLKRREDEKCSYSKIQ
jgi:hypothetical protein